MGKSSLLFVLLLLLVLGYAQAQSRVDSLLTIFTKHPEITMVAAHRGAHLTCPENSLEAIKEAIRLRVDIVELDVRETKDHELVVIHDKKVDRTTNGKGKVANFTLAELKQLRLVYNNKVTTQQILTLEEALLAAKDSVIVDIDFKADTKEAVVKVCKLLQKHHMQKQVLFYVYHDYALIESIKQLDAQIKVMPRAYNKRDVKLILDYVGIKAIHIDFSFYNDEVATTIANYGSRVWGNAIETYDKEQLKHGTGYYKITQKHVSIIQTDYPEALLYYLKQSGLHR